MVSSVSASYPATAKTSSPPHIATPYVSVDVAIPNYGLFELDLPYSTIGLNDPFVQVTSRATFISPSQKHIDIEGFYYDTNTFKMRFSPREIGIYTYSGTLSGGPTGNQNFSGTFISIVSDDRGSIILNPNIPYKLMFEDGTNFYGIGFNMTSNDRKIAPDTPLIAAIGSTGFYGFGVETDPNEGGWVDVDTYFQKYEDAGFTLYRWNDGGSLNLKAAPATKIANGKEADQILLSAKRHHFNSMLTFFGPGTCVCHGPSRSYRGGSVPATGTICGGALWFTHIDVGVAQRNRYE